MEIQPEHLSKIEYFFNGKLKDAITDSSDYPMLLMVLGEKPAALSMNANEEQVNVLEEFCKQFGFTLKLSEGRTSKPKDSLGNQPFHNQCGAFVAVNKNRMKVLEASEGRFYGFSDKAVGEFLGFPEESVEFFNSCEQPGLESRKKIQEMKEDGAIQADLKYLNLTTYIPCPNEKAVKEAIKVGKRREKILEELDNKLNTDIGSNYIERRFDNNFYQ